MCAARAGGCARPRFFHSPRRRYATRVPRCPGPVFRHAAICAAAHGGHIMQGLSRRAAVCAASLLLTFLAPVAGARAADTEPRIDLRVLVVDDGGEATAAVAAELDGAGTPYTEVDLSDAGRPQIDAAFLSDTVDGRPRAKYQAVVLPNDNPFGAGSAEMAALTSYEQTYGIRQIDAYTYAQPAVGLNWAENPGYMGSLDGVTAQVTAAGLAGPFGYLDGPVPFEDNAADVSESYGY